MRSVSARQKSDKGNRKMYSPRFIFEIWTQKMKGLESFLLLEGMSFLRVKVQAVSSSLAVGFASHPLREESALRHCADLWWSCLFQLLFRKPFLFAACEALGKSHWTVISASLSTSGMVPELGPSVQQQTQVCMSPVAGTPLLSAEWKARQRVQ